MNTALVISLAVVFVCVFVVILGSQQKEDDDNEE